MRSAPALALLLLAALACGGGDADTREDGSLTPGPATEAGPVEEDPGLPTKTTEFRPTGSAEPTDGGIGGRLWTSTAATVEEDGFSLIAQLRNLPDGRAYSWAVHRGDCAADDDRLFGLGWGTVADAEGRGEGVANGGGPLGDMPLTFTPRPDGTAEETVFVPMGEQLTLAQLDAASHSLRLHPNVDGAEPGPSVACAPIPELPRPGEYDPERPAAGERQVP